MVSGFVTIKDDSFVFEPIDSDFKGDKVRMYRIVQIGFRKKLQFIPFKFYIKTSSGAVFYYLSPYSRKIIKFIEKIVY